MHLNIIAIFCHKIILWELVELASREWGSMVSNKFYLLCQILHHGLLCQISHSWLHTSPNVSSTSLAVNVSLPVERSRSRTEHVSRMANIFTINHASALPSIGMDNHLDTNICQAMYAPTIDPWRLAYGGGDHIVQRNELNCHCYGTCWNGATSRHVDRGPIKSNARSMCAGDGFMQRLTTG